MADLKPCGTRAAFRRHIKRGEQPCAACVGASAREDRERHLARWASGGREKTRAYYWANRERIIAAAAKRQGLQGEPAPRDCAVCGKPFMSAAYQQRYCSDECLRDGRAALARARRRRRRAAELTVG